MNLLQLLTLCRLLTLVVQKVICEEHAVDVSNFEESMPTTIQKQALPDGQEFDKKKFMEKLRRSIYRYAI
ncbi:MAG: hypothetical protein MHMPM18_004553 [Marteilia pararefringens]